MARILLVEDDESMCRFLEQSLTRAGHHVEAHDCAEDALKALHRQVYDLLLTDIVMPGIDGIELANRAAELDPDMRVVFITGFAAVALSGDRPAPNGARLLSKPFHLRELVEEIDRVLDAA